MFADLTNPDSAYLIGLLQTDGHHSGDIEHKGRVQLELAGGDAAILVAVSALLPCYSSVRYRVRTTNFKAEYRTATLTFCDQATRRRLVELGVPAGRKSSVIAPPPVPFSKADYVRGLLDGDGSVGFTCKGQPFVSFVTASEELAQFYCDTIWQVCGVRRTARRNTRDAVFNILVLNTAAATFAAWAWQSSGTLGIDRKRATASRVAMWRPPEATAARFGVARRPWNDDEDDVILTIPVEEAAQRLGRTEQSIKMRLWRLLGPATATLGNLGDN